jgi:hypothetical protein
MQNTEGRKSRDTVPLRTKRLSKQHYPENMVIKTTLMIIALLLRTKRLSNQHCLEQTADHVRII